MTHPPFDSLADVLKHHEALINSLIAARRTPTHVVIDSAPNRFDWSQPISAIVGALIGGWLTSRSASATIKQEYAFERSHAISRLRNRVRVNLERVIKMGVDCAKLGPLKPIPTTVGEGLEVVWNLYYRVAEPIFSEGTSGLAARVDELFVKTHILAERTKALEMRAIDVGTVGHESQKYRDTAKAREAIPGERETLLAEIVTLGGEASALLKDLEAQPLVADTKPQHWWTVRRGLGP